MVKTVQSSGYLNSGQTWITDIQVSGILMAMSKKADAIPNLEYEWWPKSRMQSFRISKLIHIPFNNLETPVV